MDQKGDVMVSRLRPPKIGLDFDDRAYRLGETINLTITLDPGRDVEVKEGRVDLVCEVRYTESFTVDIPLAGSQGSGYAVSSVPSKQHKKHKDTHVHSSVAFLNDTRLQSGRAHTYNSRLEIGPEPPPNTGPEYKDAKVKWTLVASADVVQGRDPKSRRAVQMVLGS